MIEQPVSDWDDAYENSGNIPHGSDYPARWQARAEQFRSHQSDECDIPYGTNPRERYDLFRPDAKKFATLKGLFVFVHGGYWQRTDKSFWSFLASGPLQAGWAVAMPSYVLCPDASLAGIEKMISKAIIHAAGVVDGPLILAGHSAGGHLVQLMMCEDTLLTPPVQQRLQHVLSISGIADLRPLLKTRLNDALQLDMPSAIAASPIFKTPNTTVPITAWVGAGERSEFIRQNALIANVWRGLGARARVVEEPDRHHFDVIEGLCNEGSPMLQAILTPESSQR